MEWDAALLAAQEAKRLEREEQLDQAQMDNAA
jgi:heme exporter protein D